MYVEHEEVKKRKWFETEKFLDIHQVKFTGFRCPRPLFKFEHANFPDYIMNVIRSEEASYSRPTALQCMCWPVLLSGRDLIAVSNSGYGKHLAYIIPIILHIKKEQADFREMGHNQNGPIALILTPHQASKDDIYSTTKSYLDSGQIRCVTIYETDDKESQIEKLKQNCDILIANPIRLIELIEENEHLVNLADCTFLVVDEYIQFRKTQTMDSVKQIVDNMRSDRQTVVFSRLVPSGIQRQGDEFVKNCVFFEMHYDKESPNDEIKQIIELCDKHMKVIRTVELVDKLTSEKDCKILIYAKDKEKCLNLNFELKRHLDIEVFDFRKEEQQFFTTPNCVMTTFKNIGLEISISDLNYIINVDFPPNMQTYMDRLRKGVTHYTLFSRENAKHAERLIYSLKQARQEIPSGLVTMSKAWLECARDLRFMPMMEDIQKGISRPIQEMILSSDDEIMSPASHGKSNTTSDSYSYPYRSGYASSMPPWTHGEDMEDEDEAEEEEDEEEDAEDD